MKRFSPWLIILGAIVVFALWIFSAYNSFVRLNENVATAWSQVENQYQRRYDLIPNLVETVKGIANQEKQVFTAVTEARARAGQVQVTPATLTDPQAFARFETAQAELGGALSRLLVTVENYPELKSNENFLALQNQLEGTENRIAVERMRFNEVTRVYNIKAKSLPGVWFVSWFGFDKEKQLLTVAPGADKNPAVKF